MVLKVLAVELSSAAPTSRLSMVIEASMMLKNRIMKLIYICQPMRMQTMTAVCRSFSVSSCTQTNLITTTGEGESPELPTWFRSQARSDGDNDDFVIPSLASWVNQKLCDRNEVKSHLSDKPETNIDRISKVLKIGCLSYEEAVEALNRCGMIASNSLVEQLLKRFNNDWVSAYGVFMWAKTQTGYRHTPELYNAVVEILGKPKRFDLMWDLIREMEQLKYVSLDTMSRVMRKLTRAGRYSDAIETFKGLEQFGVSRDNVALGILMDALAKEDSVEHAYQVFIEFKDLIPLDSLIFNILIHGFCKARKLEDARKIMAEMEKLGFHPNVVSYTCFIEAYCRDKDFGNVDAILNEMQLKGCIPSVVTYTIIMHARGKAGEISEALEVHEKMKTHGCLPDASFYSSLAFILSKADRFRDAVEVFKEMMRQGVKPDVMTYNTMIASACKAGQEERAFKFLQEMEEVSCQANLKTYAPLLKLCCRKKWMKLLNFLLDHMFKNNVSIDLGTYALLVRGLCKSGKLAQACSFFEESTWKGMVHRDSTYKMLVEELERNGMVEAKEKIQKLMIKVDS